MKDPFKTLLRSNLGRRGLINFGLVMSFVSVIALTPALARGESLAGAARQVFGGGAQTMSRALDSVETVAMEVVDVFSDPRRLELAITGSSAPFRRER